MPRPGQCICVWWPQGCGLTGGRRPPWVSSPWGTETLTKAGCSDRTPGVRSPGDMQRRAETSRVVGPNSFLLLLARITSWATSSHGQL